LTALSSDRRQRLLKFLGGLPPAAAAKLFATIEADRARGGKSLPHGLLIDALRPELARVGRLPSRPKTAQRIFFAPFEDFLVVFRTGKKRRARIARASLAPIWEILEHDPACAAAQRAIAQLQVAIRENSANLEACEESLFAAAEQGLSRLVARAEADADFRDSLEARLGGEGAFEDLSEITSILPAVPHLKDMQKAFPRPITALSEEELYTARRLYADARAFAPTSAPYLLLALAGRMERPWRAMRVYYHLSEARDDALSAAGEDAQAVLETLFDDLEGGARALERDAAGDFDARDAELKVIHFADFAEGLAGEAARAGDNVVFNRVEACRDIASDALARFAEQSLAALRRAMPVRHAGGSTRLMAMRPDYARPAPPKTLADAREAAEFLADSAEMARRLERDAIAQAIVEDAIEETRRYGGDLVLEIRAAEGEERIAARRLMEQIFDIAAPLLPPGEIGLLRERAAAAALTA